MAGYKERDAFPEVPDYKINIGDNLDGGLLSTSDIYSPKSEPALIDNVLDPSEDILKEIVVLIDEFGKKTLKKSFTKELRIGNSMGATDGTNASALRGAGVAKQSSEFGMCEKGHSHKDQEDFDLCAKAEATSKPTEFKIPPPGILPKKKKGGGGVDKALPLVPLAIGAMAGGVMSSDDGEPKRSSEKAVIKSINKFLEG